jgi:hypothetical protein
MQIEGMKIIGPDPLGERERIFNYLQELASGREQDQRGHGSYNILRQMNYVRAHFIEAIEDKYPALVEKALGRAALRKLKVIIENIGTSAEPDIQIIDKKTGEMLKDGFKNLGDAVRHAESEGWLWKFGRTASMSKIARELLEVARSLVSSERMVKAVRSNFLVVRSLPLVREGATRDSLENARRILDAGYILHDGTFSFDSNRADWITKARFRWSVDESIVEHEFHGFSFGYSGEGPRGLVEFLKMFHWNPDPNKIFSNQFGMEKGTVALSDFT